MNDQDSIEFASTRMNELYNKVQFWRISTVAATIMAVVGWALLIWESGQ
jgi:anti-sigma-K factor RskA